MNLFFQIVVTVFIACAANAAQSNPFIISFWCAPPPSLNYDAQYAEVAEAHFTHVLPPCAGASVAENKAILDACEKHGLKFFPMDGRRDTYVETHPNFSANMDAILTEYSKHPAYAGLFLNDEPRLQNFKFLAAQNHYLLKKDPAHLPFLNLMPNYATAEQLGGTNYEAYVEMYCRTVTPRLLCYDHYPFFEKNFTRGNFFENMETIRRAGIKHDIPFGFIFQTTPHGTYRDPSETDLRWQVNIALAYGSKALFYFTYFTPTDVESNFHNGIIDQKGKRTAKFELAKKINRELKTLAPMLMQLTSTEVFHTGKIPAGCMKLPPDAPIQVSENSELIIGFFKHVDASRWAVIVNRDLQKPILTTVSFDKKTKKLKELDPQDGKLISLKLKKQKATFAISAGGITFLKLNP
ncbi:MAG: hypothetical protein M3Y82_03530 [Verrucomicrobiota bacterium]|nr:hypothetical protein [Verrucomicrobiota bacterium]